jgi:branched-chain amino acid aminotransferase
MIATVKIPVTQSTKSKLEDVIYQDLPFGSYFTDHMLEADFEDGEWKNVQIRPYQPLMLEPSLAALHYGQAIFEGMKAYKNPDGEAFIFRPFEHFNRFNISAARLQMPVIPEEIFIEGLKQLVALDHNWIPRIHDHALYIRPMMFSSDERIGVRPSDNYKFLAILCPSAPLHGASLKIYVEENYVRAVPGGVGFAKAAGNYAAAMYPTAEAQKKGYDQVLWTDAFEHKYVQEIGTMNVIFIIGDKAFTPDLSAGTILDGISRNSALMLIQERGMEIVEKNISVDELVEAYNKGELKEVFGTGTAATISMIRELRYKDFVMQFDISTWKVAPAIKKQLMGIREGTEPDTYGWMWKVK